MLVETEYDVVFRDNYEGSYVIADLKNEVH